MKLPKQLFILSILVLAALSANAADTIKVASIFAKTGAASVGNKTAINGVRFAVNELNRQGGLLGMPVEIIEFDNHSSALGSRQAAEKAVKAGVVTVFGANWSSHSLGMAPVLQKAGIPMISPFSTNPDVTRIGDYIFRVCFIDSFQGRVMADFATRDLKAKTAAILINASGRYSEGLADFFRKQFTRLGGEIVFEAHYLQDATDFSRQLSELILLKPDVLFVPGNIGDSGQIVKQAREKKYHLPILGGDGWGDGMYRYAGESLEGTYYSGHWHDANRNPGSLRFVEQYNAKYGDVEKDGAALSYDAVFLFAAAVRRAGSTAPDRIRDALSKSKDYRGITGNITFNENRNPIKSAVIMKFVNGKSVYVKTIDP